MSMFKNIPVEVGEAYEGERIRRRNMQVELGGPSIQEKFELAKVKPLTDVEDEKITIIGPDIKDMTQGKAYPLGILVEVAGPTLDQEFEGVIERRIHGYMNYIGGIMHLNQRYDIWIRLGKKAFQKGLNSFQYIGKVLFTLYKSELSIIEKIQVTFITDPVKIQKLHPNTLKEYEARDARARGLKDVDVENFYGCALCQSFAPSHVCVITPQRYSNCGSISWFDGRAAASIDPNGPLFAIKRGELINAEKGEYAGVNEVAKKKTLGDVEKVWLYTVFDHPHTSCGCFEAIAFYIPEVEGLGVVHRSYKGMTVNGLPFSTLANSTAGGRQIDGFHGLSIEYMRSTKFLDADGGWDCITWLPKEIKERVKDFIPKELVNKIATEENAQDVVSLKAFLKENKHPVVTKWEKEPKEAILETSVEQPVEDLTMPVLSASTLPLTAGGFKIILKDAKIFANKVIIKTIRNEKNKK